MRKNPLLLAVILASLFIFGSCKSKQENYSTSYERAKAKPSVYVIEEVEPVTKPTEPIQKEKLTTISGPAVNNYSVIIGSFVNKTNATSLKERMEKQGYTPTLAQNEKGMYRVLLSTFDNQAHAIKFKEEIIRKYAPEFYDTWVLEQEQ